MPKSKPRSTRNTWWNNLGSFSWWCVPRAAREDENTLSRWCVQRAALGEKIKGISRICLLMPLLLDGTAALVSGWMAGEQLDRKMPNKNRLSFSFQLQTPCKPASGQTRSNSSVILNTATPTIHPPTSTTYFIANRATLTTDQKNNSYTRWNNRKTPRKATGVCYT